jgi:GntR family transcriptional repressor for pyruvate dehydrogenase complex
MDFLFLLDDISLQDLMELRLMLEPALAAKAAERATTEDIDLLKQSMREMQEKGISAEEIAAADLLFHRTIFRATGNALGSRLFHTIHSTLFKMISSTAQVVHVEHTVRFHRRIFEAIEQRNSKAAAECMTEHLDDARHLLLRQQKKQESLRLRRHLVEGRERPVVISKQPVAPRGKRSRAVSLAASSAR